MKAKLIEAVATGIEAADTNKDGKLDLPEFIAFTSTFSETITKEFAQYWFRGLDIDITGRLTFDVVRSHFQMMIDHWDEIENNKPPVELLKVYYRGMDRDRNAQVNLEEMRNFLQSNDEKMNTHMAAVKLRKMDKDNSGTISFYEYCISFGHEVPKSIDPYDGKGPSQCCLIL